MTIRVARLLRTFLRLVPLRSIGAALAPTTTFLALQGLDTLPLRTGPSAPLFGPRQRHADASCPNV